MWSIAIAVAGVGVAPMVCALGWIVGARVGDRRGLLGYYTGGAAVVFGLTAAYALH